MGDVNRSEQVVWAAGLLEGEGTFLLKPRTTYPIVQIQMTDLDVLERIKDIYGGSIYTVTKRKEHWKDTWVWNLSGAPAIECMVQVRPYMLSRRAKKIDFILAERSEFLEKKSVEKQEMLDLRAQVLSDYEQGKGSVRGLAKIYGLNRGTVFRWITSEKAKAV